MYDEFLNNIYRAKTICWLTEWKKIIANIFELLLSDKTSSFMIWLWVLKPCDGHFSLLWHFIDLIIIDSSKIFYYTWRIVVEQTDTGYKVSPSSVKSLSSVYVYWMFPVFPSHLCKLHIGPGSASELVVILLAYTVCLLNWDFRRAWRNFIRWMWKQRLVSNSYIILHSDQSTLLILAHY